MVAVLLAFEYRSSSRVIFDEITDPHWETDTEIMPITRPTPPPPPPPPPDRQDFDVVPDDLDFDDSDLIIDQDAYADLAVYELYIGDLTKPEDDVDENLIIDRPEIMPEFPGGVAELYRYLGENIRYPRLAIDLSIHGTVYAEFVIERDGSVSNVQIVRGIGAGCDEEAARVIAGMPKWIPRTHAVRVRYTLSPGISIAAHTFS
jgi:periplasmic protein TonB